MLLEPEHLAVRAELACWGLLEQEAEPLLKLLARECPREFSSALRRGLPAPARRSPPERWGRPGALGRGRPADRPGGPGLWAQTGRQNLARLVTGARTSRSWCRMRPSTLQDPARDGAHAAPTRFDRVLWVRLGSSQRWTAHDGSLRTRLHQGDVGSSGRKDLLSDLAPRLADRVEAVRDQAARAILRIGSQSGALLGPVLGQLRELPVAGGEALAPEPAPGILALESLRYPNDVPEIASALLETLDSAPPEILGAVPETLVYCSDRDRLARELRARLGSERRDTRVYSLYCLALLREPGCAEDFLAGVDGDDAVGIIAGATGLALIEARSAIPRLREAYARG